MAQIDKTPTSFELVILKWFVLPVVLLVGIYALISDRSDRKQCESTCHEKGFQSFRYTAKGRFTSSDTCSCLSKDDIKIKDRVPEGKKIY